MLTHFAPRFYATILIALFIYNATKIWFRYVWPEIRVKPSPLAEFAARADINRYTLLHPNLMTLEELGQEISRIAKFCDHFVIANMLILRQEKPIVFCSMVCGSLYVLACIGDKYSGYTILFWVLTVICLGPGAYIHLLPEDLKIKLRSFVTQMKQKIEGGLIEVKLVDDDADGDKKHKITTSDPRPTLVKMDEDKQSQGYLEKYMNIAQQPILNLLGISSNESLTKLITEGVNFAKTSEIETSGPSPGQEQGTVSNHSSQSSMLRRRSIKTSSSDSSMEAFVATDYECLRRTSESNENSDVVQDGFVIL